MTSFPEAYHPYKIPRGTFSAGSVKVIGDGKVRKTVAIALGKSLCYLLGRMLALATAFLYLS